MENEMKVAFGDENIANSQFAET